MDDKYSVYSEFDMKKHKETYVNYLEVIIDENGKVMYAIPGHIMKLEELTKDKLNLSSVKEVRDLCPSEMHGDYIKWLLSQCKCISVWTRMCIYDSINKKQYFTLRSLKINGLYHGPLTSSM